MKEAKEARPNELLLYERERRHWSQADVAERMQLPETKMVGRWERGHSRPSPRYIQQLCKLFEKSARELGLVPDDEVPFWNVPYRRNSFFTGREALLAHLHTHLFGNETAEQNQPVVISGLGGIGKTQIALEYAYRYSHEYQAVLWIRAESREVLSSDFAALATVLNLPEKNAQDQSMAINAVKSWLAALTRWHLILDNVEDLQMIGDFLPLKTKGHILVTTRSQVAGSMAHLVEVDTMEIEEGALFLLRRAKLIPRNVPLDPASYAHWAQARTIAQAMDGLPLALDQAGAYIEETKCSLNGYMDLYQTHRITLLKERGKWALDHSEAVVGTFLLSFERVQQVNPAAADLLRLCSFLAHDTISEEIITKGASELGPNLEAVVADPFQLNIAIRDLLKYSLIRRDPEIRTLAVHWLVQVVLKDTMDPRTQQMWAERAVRVINRAFPAKGIDSYADLLRKTERVHEALKSEEQEEIIHSKPRQTHTKLLTEVDKSADTQFSRVSALSGFLAACCEQHPYALSSANELWIAYQYWIQRSGERFPITSQRAFAMHLKALGYKPYRTNKSRLWLGIALREPPKRNSDA